MNSDTWSSTTESNSVGLLRSSHVHFNNLLLWSGESMGKKFEKPNLDDKTYPRLSRERQRQREMESEKIYCSSE